jgi:hypothetical protein
VGAEGSYIATIVFPTAGDWTLTFDSADLVMEGTADIGVAAAAPVAAPIIAPVEAAATAAATTFDAMPLLLAIVLIAAILAIAIGGLFLRSRGAGHSQVPVRN